MEQRTKKRANKPTLPLASPSDGGALRRAGFVALKSLKRETQAVPVEQVFPPELVRKLAGG